MTKSRVASGKANCERLHAENERLERELNSGEACVACTWHAFACTVGVLVQDRQSLPTSGMPSTHNGAFALLFVPATPQQSRFGICWSVTREALKPHFEVVANAGGHRAPSLQRHAVRWGLAFLELFEQQDRREGSVQRAFCGLSSCTLLSSCARVPAALKASQSHTDGVLERQFNLSRNGALDKEEAHVLRMDSNSLAEMSVDIELL